MVTSQRARVDLLTILCCAAFAVGFPISTHFVPGGQSSGVLLAVPLVLIAWQRGLRAGIVAAIAGVLYIRSVLSVEFFLIQRHHPDGFWIAAALEMSLAYLLIGAAVGRLSDTLRRERETARLREDADRAARRAEQSARELIDASPQGICVIQDTRFAMCNRRMLDLTGNPRDDLRLAAVKDIVMAEEDRRAALDLLERVLEGSGDDGEAVFRVACGHRGPRWLHFHGRKVTWEGRAAALCFVADVTDREVAGQALRARHAHLETLLRTIPDLAFEMDREGRLYEMPPRPPQGRTLREILPAEAAAICMDAVQRASRTGSSAGATYSLAVDGEERWYELSIAAIGDPAAPGTHFVALARDITQRRSLEEQCRQSGTMEAVARLAGGIAHEFNNILQIILGFCGLIKDHTGDTEETREAVSLISASAQRAASLTGQLLAFSRKQVTHPAIRDVNAFLRNAEEPLRRVLGDRVVLSMRTEHEPEWVSVDPCGLEQALLHLARNAREAMPDGGRLSIEVRRLEITPQTLAAPAGVGPGRYAVLTIRDTGVGMDAVTLSHVFEPFFTTKETGKGLGLSLVYGMIRQMGGAVLVSSRPGAGTRVRVYLPLIGGSEPDPAVERGGSD